MTIILTDNILGRVVYSKTGRDKGKIFVIIQVVNDRYVMLADGDLRKIENPKMKNVCHLKFTRMKADDVMECSHRGEHPDNHIILKI